MKNKTLLFVIVFLLLPSVCFSNELQLKYGKDLTVIPMNLRKSFEASGNKWENLTYEEREAHIIKWREDQLKRQQQFEELQRKKNAEIQQLQEEKARRLQAKLEAENRRQQKLQLKEAEKQAKKQAFLEKIEKQRQKMEYLKSKR